ncbi:MAG: NfeD family protein [Nitrospiraceae bacterium]
MVWWYWMVLGLVLIGLELVTPGGFYLFFFGLSALLVGAFGGLGLTLPTWVEWCLFTVFAVASLLMFRKPLARATAALPGRHEVDSVVGEHGVVVQAMAEGAMGKVELRGSHWNACNAGPGLLVKDQRCRVDRVDGLTLWVTAA